MARAIDGTKATKEVMEYSRKLREAGNVDAAGYVMWAALIVDKQPTIDHVKHGHWEEMRNAYGKLEGWIHAECGREVKCMEDYCPKCGARMDGE